jgi:hypothetical protein
MIDYVLVWTAEHLLLKMVFLLGLSGQENILREAWLMRNELLAKCTYPGCKNKAENDNYYACRIHWATLPKDIQSRLLIGLKKVTSDRWFSAHTEALDFWNKKLCDGDE